MPTRFRKNILRIGKIFDESINPHAFNIISVTKINYFKLVACPWINSAVSAVAKNPPTNGEKQSRI